MSRANLTSPLVANPSELEGIALEIGIGIYASRWIDFIVNMINQNLRQLYPNNNWQLLVYAGEDHMRELIQTSLPHVLIVSSYWGHSGYSMIDRYIDDMLEAIITRRSRGSVFDSALVILLNDGILKRYKKGVHYDLCMSEADFFDLISQRTLQNLITLISSGLNRIVSDCS